MSKRDDDERAEISRERRIEVTKRVRRDMDAAVAAAVDDVPIAEIARRLSVSRDVVYDWLKVLGWIPSNPYGNPRRSDPKNPRRSDPKARGTRAAAKRHAAALVADMEV